MQENLPEFDPELAKEYHCKFLEGVSKIPGVKAKPYIITTKDSPVYKNLKECFSNNVFKVYSDTNWTKKFINELYDKMQEYEIDILKEKERQIMGFTTEELNKNGVYVKKDDGTYVKFCNVTDISIRHEIGVSNEHVTIEGEIDPWKTVFSSTDDSPWNRPYTLRFRNDMGNPYRIDIEHLSPLAGLDTHYGVTVHDLSLGRISDASIAGKLYYKNWDDLHAQLLIDLYTDFDFHLKPEVRRDIAKDLSVARRHFGGNANSIPKVAYYNGPSVKVDTFWKNGSLKRQIDNLYKNPFEAMPKIEKVIFNPPATIVQWKDGTKTVVKCQDGDEFDWEKGLAMAYVKRAFGNERSYYGLFKKNEPEIKLQGYPMPGTKKLTVIVPKEVDTKELNEKFMEWLNKVEKELGVSADETGKGTNGKWYKPED